MLEKIRKFSSSIYAKILLGIVIIPFVFWGMGSSFKGGSKNVVVIIEKEKHSVQSFIDFIRKFSPPDKKIGEIEIEEFLSAFIGDKLLEKEVENFKIKLSDNSLSRLIKHQKEFKRNDNFSRVEYEGFLLKNNITATEFESNLAKAERKKHFLNFIGGGVVPSKFLINDTFNKINQKRNVEIINLNKIFDKKINLSEDQIKTYYEKNKDEYIEEFKTIFFVELNPKKLIDDNEFSDLFYKKIDEIDYMIIEGNNLDTILEKYNLKKGDSLTLNKEGKNLNSQTLNEIPKKIVEKIFNINEIEQTSLIEYKDKYFVVEIIKTENIQKKLENAELKKSIILNLQNKVKRELISEIIDKINKNTFKKSDFYKMSENEKVAIKKVTIKNRNDNQILEKDLINQIYSYPEKRIIVAHDISFIKNFLIYIDAVENVTINNSSDEYQKYLNLSRMRITNDLYETYDKHIMRRYEIDINYKALEVVKNYFN